MDVIKLARTKLVELENQTISKHHDSGQFEMFSDRPHPVIEKLQELNVDDLTPRAALDLLYSLKHDAKE